MMFWTYRHLLLSFYCSVFNCRPRFLAFGKQTFMQTEAYRCRFGSVLVGCCCVACLLWVYASGARCSTGASWVSVAPLCCFQWNWAPPAIRSRSVSSVPVCDGRAAGHGPATGAPCDTVQWCPGPNGRRRYHHRRFVQGDVLCCSEPYFDPI